MQAGNTLALTNPNVGSMTWNDMRQIADTLVKSGFLPSAIKNAEQALTIMLMGQALDLHFMIAFQGINIIAGKPSVSPQLMIALARRNGQLESLQTTDDGHTCTCIVKRRGEPAHTEKFSMDDADRMMTTEYENGNKITIPLSKKKNWKEQPATMRKWRAVAAAFRLIFPDAVWGIASYTPDELGATVTYNDDGSILTIEEVPEENAAAQPITPPSPTTPEQAPKLWYEVPENTAKYAKWLKDEYDFTVEDSVKLLGKPLSEFPDGKEACLAVKAKMKPAQPSESSQKPADTPQQQSQTKPAPKWHEITDEHRALQDYINRFDISSRDFEQLTGVKWEDFQTRTLAEEFVRKMAVEKGLPMLATKGTYSLLANNKSGVIEFDSVISMKWFQGRTKLAETLQSEAGHATQDWSDVKDWQPGTHKLPEQVKVYMKRDDKNQLVIDRIEACDPKNIPF